MLAGTNRSVISSATLTGTAAAPVEVTCALHPGVPGHDLYGFGGGALDQDRMGRIRLALRASGYDMPRSHLTLTCAPATAPAPNYQLDLACALAILEASGQVAPLPSGLMAVGELGMSGQVETVRGTLAYHELCRVLDLELVCGLAHDPGVMAHQVSALAELRHVLPEVTSAPGLWVAGDEPDFLDVTSNEQAKYAAAVAVAGGHALMLHGDGNVAARIATRVATIMDDLSATEWAMLWRIRSCCGLDHDGVRNTAELRTRAPHHSISVAGLLGGGSPIMPGEVTLAHKGVLFLDGIQDFSRGCIEALGQPQAEGKVRITRRDVTCEMPADFQLVASDADLAGWHVAPPADRMVARIPVHATCEHDSHSLTLSSAAARDIVQVAREFQEHRIANHADPYSTMTASAWGMLDRMAAEQGRDRREVATGLVPVARTLADIEHSMELEPRHIEQAIDLSPHAHITNDRLRGGLVTPAEVARQTEQALYRSQGAERTSQPPRRAR